MADESLIPHAGSNRLVMRVERGRSNVTQTEQVGEGNVSFCRRKMAEIASVSPFLY